MNVSPVASRTPLIPTLLLGVGLGGFVDGIVFHQILQWHHLLTATGDHPADTVRGFEGNTLADGLFHVAAWMFVAVGSTLTVRAWGEGRLAPPWRVHVGLLLVGWGVFNVLEGVINHHVLTLHHVRDDVTDPTGWDISFLVFGVALVASGVALAWSALSSGDA